MSKNITYLIFLSFLFIVTNACHSSRTMTVEAGWDLLGERTVNFARDVDELPINSTVRYTALRFKVERREVKINDLTIIYANLDKMKPSIDEIVLADQFSKVIELGPEGKDIRSIEFRYRTTGNVLKGRATVLVFGRRYTTGY